jgi:tetratricopeptide (TPR) repeat protein
LEEFIHKQYVPRASGARRASLDWDEIKDSLMSTKEDLMKKIFPVILTLIVAGCGAPPSEQSLEPEQKFPVSAQTGKANAGPVVQAAQERSKKLIETGLESLRQSDIQSAIKNFDEAIKTSPKDLRGYVVLGQTYLRSKKYDRAIDTFSAATRVAPQDGDLYFMLATSYGLAGKKDQAVKAAQQSAELFRQKKDQVNFRKAVLFLQGLMQPASVQKES